MKQILTAFVCAWIATACASRKADDEPVTPVSAPAVASVQDSRLAEQQTVINELLDRLEVLNSRIQRLEAGAPQPQAQAAERVVETPSVQPATVSETAGSPVPEEVQAPSDTASRLAGAAVADRYREALTLYGKARYPQSRDAFQRVFESDPTGELADNALYWIGETYYVTGKYTEAIKYYRRITEEFADQNKAPDAMLKIGLAFEKSGDLALARRAFEEVVQKYPYSTPAATARQEMKRIKY